MSTAELYQAQQALASAQARHDQQEREQKIKLLGDLRQQLHEHRDEYNALERSLRAEDEQRQRLRHQVRQLQYAVSESLAAQPEIFSYLPQDRECVQWKRNHERIEHELADAEKKLAAVPQSDRLRYVHVGNNILTLEYRIGVVLSDLDGSLGKVPASSIGAVHE